MIAARIQASVDAQGGATSAKDNASPDAPMHAASPEKRFETSVGLMWRLNSVVASAIASRRMVAASPAGILTAAMLLSAGSGVVAVLIEVRAWRNGTVTARNLERARRQVRAQRRWENAPSNGFNP